MSRNAALLLGARVVSAASTVLLLIYIGQTLGGVALGVAGIGLAMGALLSAVTDSGTGSLLIREGAREPARLGQLLGAMTMWRIVVIPIAAGAVWLIISSTISTRPGAVFLLALGLAVQQFADLTRAVFIARQEMSVSSLHATIENASWLVVIVAFLASGASLELAFAAGLMVFLLSTLAGFVLVIWSGTPSISLPDAASLRVLGRQLGPFAAFMIVGVAYSRIDTLLVGALTPTGALAAAGAYFAAVRLLASMEYVPEAVARASFPRVARAFRQGGAEVAAELRPLASFLVVAGMPVPLIMIIGGPWLMTALFGADVAPYAWLVIPLSIVVPLRFLSHLFGMALTSTDAQGRRVFAVVVALAIVLVLDLVLIPLIGIAGAVIGSVGGSVWVFVVYAIPMARHAGTLGLLGTGVRSLAVVAVLGALAVVLVPVIGNGATVALVAVAYGIAVIALGQVRLPMRAGGTG